MTEPVYQQIANKLQSERGLLDQPMKLPPEDQLARSHKVARQTIRRTLQLLEEAGAVTRQRKVGTFLQPRRPQPGSIEGAHLAVIPPWWSDSEQSWFTSRAVDAVSRQVHQHGAYTSILHVSREPDHPAQWIKDVRGRDIAGLIWLHPKGMAQQQLIEQAAKELPCVVVGRQFNNDDLHYVLPDYAQAATIMDEQLVRHGHGTYAVIGGRALDPHWHFWIKSFERAHARRDAVFELPGTYIDTEPFSRKYLGEMLHQYYLADHREIKAFVLTTSAYLLGMVNHSPFRDLLEKDLSIITIDIGAYPIDAYWPGRAISHVACDWQEISRGVVETIGAQINGRVIPKARHVPVVYQPGDTLHARGGS